MKIIRYCVIVALWFVVLHCSAQTSPYDQLNRIRIDAGQKPLRRSLILEIRAKSWLMRTSRYRGLIHGRGPEVLTTCDDPVPCWMASKPHRRLLMSNKKRIGIAMYRGVACGKLR